MRSLTGIDRFIAFILACVWLGAGVAGFIIAIVDTRLLLGLVSLLAVGDACLWFRVFARSRLLTWTALAMPWRVP